MIAEFIEFIKIIDGKDFKAANQAFKHSLETLAVLQEAKKQR